MKRFALLLMPGLAACSTADDPTLVTFSGEWSIDRGRVFDGGPGLDGIPALTDPRFISPEEASFLGPNDLVIGFKACRYLLSLDRYRYRLGADD